jgi:hypothetical protein
VMIRGDRHPGVEAACRGVRLRDINAPDDGTVLSVGDGKVGMASSRG